MLSPLPVVVEYGHCFNVKVVDSITQELEGCTQLNDELAEEVSSLNRQVAMQSPVRSTGAPPWALAGPVTPHAEESDDGVKGKGTDKGKACVIKGKGKSTQKGKYRGWMERTAALVIAVPFDSTSRFFLILVRHV